MLFLISKQMQPFAMMGRSIVFKGQKKQCSMSLWKWNLMRAPSRPKRNKIWKSGIGSKNTKVLERKLSYIGVSLINNWIYWLITAPSHQIKVVSWVLILFFNKGRAHHRGITEFICFPTNPESWSFKMWPRIVSCSKSLPTM